MTNKLKTDSKKSTKVYIVTGKENPIRVNMVDGSIKEFKEGDKVTDADWPMPHLTIPNALKNGLLKEGK